LLQIAETFDRGFGSVTQRPFAIPKFSKVVQHVGQTIL
jgi:hypothetical protein